MNKTIQYLEDASGSRTTSVIHDGGSGLQSLLHTIELFTR